MKFNVFWKDIKFLEVKKVNDLFYTNIIVENVEKVEKNGFPKSLIMNVKIIDNKLPNIIQNRLPSVDYLSEKITNTTDIEKSIIEYINTTKCKRVTDSITLEIEE